MSDRLRFRCPECSRGLAAPVTAIGKKIGCPFCQSVYEISLMIEAESTPAVAEPVPTPVTSRPNSLTRWIPESVKAAGNTAGSFAGNVAGNVANVVKAKTSAGFQAAQSTAATAANAVGNAVSGTTKRAVAAAAPLTQHVAAVASVLLPGSGEMLTGNVTQGSCTLAAFVGATGLAAAMVPLIPAAPIAGIVVAVPLGIQVFSAWQGSKHGKKAGESIRNVMEDSLTADEAKRIALNMKDAAESMSPEAFEQLIVETEERELNIVESGDHKIVLKKIR